MVSAMTADKREHRVTRGRLFAIMLATTLLAALTLAAVTLIVSCQKSGPDARPLNRKPLVLTTFFPLYDFARNVAGDHMLVENLLPAGVGPHEFSFTPKDRKRLEDARLLVKNGFGLEAFLDDFTPQREKTLVIEAAKGIVPAQPGQVVSLGEKEEGHAREPRHAPEHEHGHSEGGADPHVWLDPVNAIAQVKNIRDAMIEVDPAHRADYEANAGRYITQLEDLDREFREAIATFKRKEFVGFHSAFIYLANRYGLRQVAVFEEFPGKEPSPRYITRLIATLKQHRITVLFSEPQFSPKIIQTLSADLGLNVRPLDPLETGGFNGDSYIGVMRKNLAVLKEALNQPEKYQP